MKQFLLLLLGALVGGCATGSMTRYDEFETVKVDQMVGNNLTGSVFKKTIVCLNAMRETHWPGPVTNHTVTNTTNFVLTSVTNLIVSTSANKQIASATNALALPPSASGETNQNTAHLTAPNNSTANGETISTTKIFFVTPDSRAQRHIQPRQAGKVWATI